jgi:glycosyltransferase involved in cell wall biosynthesis
MTGAATEVSVAVATRDRAARLAALLASLRDQQGVRFEVLVCDDGSADRTPAVLTAAAADGLPLRTLRHATPRGPAAARNAAWRAATAPLVAFVDDDCRVEAGWLAALLTRWREHPAAFVQGRTDPDPREQDRHDAFSMSLAVTAPTPWYPSCNIAYPRELLERLDGFDEGFRFPAGEDTDLGWRARAAGAEPLFEPRAQAFHAVHRAGLSGRVRSAGRWADIPRVVARHPGLRADLALGVFWRRSHGPFTLALAGALVARRAPVLGAAMALPWARLYRPVHGSWPGTVAALPAHAVADAAEVGAVVAGSVRARTLVI